MTLEQLVFCAWWGGVALVKALDLAWAWWEARR